MSGGRWGGESREGREGREGRGRGGGGEGRENRRKKEILKDNDEERVRDSK